MTKPVGLAVTCGLVPAVYAAGMYLIVSNRGLGSIPPAKAPHLAALIALPLLLSGVVRWWDVWVKPLPKMGAAYDPVPPRDYLAGVFKGHGLVLAIAFVGYMALGFFADRASSPEAMAAELKKLEDEQAKVSKALAAAEAEEANLEKNTNYHVRGEAAGKVRNLRVTKKVIEAQMKETREKPAEVNAWASLPVGIFLMVCAFFTTFMAPREQSWTSGHAVTTEAAVGKRR